MSRKQITEQQFRFYEMPEEHPILAFGGESWIKNYGNGSRMLHFHNILEVGICLEGEGTMIYEHEERHYRPGDISVIPRYVPHTTYNEEGVFSQWEYVFIDETLYLGRYFGSDPAFARGMEEHINSRYLLVRSEEYPSLADSAACLAREQLGGFVYSKEVTNAQAIAFLMLTARINRDYDKGQGADRRENSRKIQDVLRFIDRNYQKPLSVGDLAGAASLSEPHFRRIFGRVMNMTPMDYLNMIRIQRACVLLKNTDLPIEIVSEKSGFVTASTFNRNFRTYMGTTPLKWKKTSSRKGEDEIRVSAYRGWVE